MNREEMILRIKEAAQSIIDNAESIVGTEKYCQKISIDIDADNLDKIPVITIRRDIIPEGYIDRITEPA